MGASYSQSSATSVQETQLEQYNSVSNECVQFADQQMDATIVVGGDVVGPIRFIQSTGQVNSTCYFNNVLDQTVDLYQEALQLADSSANNGGPLYALGLRINVSSTDSKETIKAELTNAMNNLCRTNVSQSQEVLIAVGGSVLSEEGILFDQTIEGIETQCVSENLAKIDAQLEQYIDQQAEAGGKQRGIIMTIIIVVVVLVVVVAVLGLLVSLFKGKKGTKTCEEIPTECAKFEGSELGECLKKQPIPKLPYCGLEKSTPVEKPTVKSTPVEKPTVKPATTTKK